MKKPKSFTVSTKILRVSPLAELLGTVQIRHNDNTGNDRIMTHRLILAKSKSFDEANAYAATIKRDDGKPVSAWLNRNDGKYAIDISQQQASILASSAGVKIEDLELYGNECSITLTVELRKEGDEYIAVGDLTGTVKTYDNRSHGAITDLVLNLPSTGFNPAKMEIAKMRAYSAAIEKANTVRTAVRQPVVDEVDPEVSKGSNPNDDMDIENNPLNEEENQLPNNTSKKPAKVK